MLSNKTGGATSNERFDNAIEIERVSPSDRQVQNVNFAADGTVLCRYEVLTQNRPR